MGKPKKKENVITNDPNAVGIRVFVYGTLKRLHYNHVTLSNKDIKDTEFLGRCYITGPFQMRNLTFYPGVQRVADSTEKHRIYGEVYRIGENTLEALDILEGNGYFFTREQVDTPWKKAWAYFIPPTYEKGSVIKEGVWNPNDSEKEFIHSGKEQLSAAEYFASCHIV